MRKSLSREIQHPERVVEFLYTNYRGEQAIRRVIPDRIWFGSTEWHREPQWLLDAFDVTRGTERSFALMDIVTFVSDTAGHVPHGPTIAVSS